MPHDLIAVVPTFRPTNSAFENVRALAAHCEVLISDDASPCTSDEVLAALSRLPNVHVIRHAHNRGIARGLNDGVSHAHERGAAWLLTLDQDTRIPADYISKIHEFALAIQTFDRPVGVVGAEHIRDRSGTVRYPLVSQGGLLTTDEVIQSGSLWSVEALTLCGGFDEALGIDAVDAAACLRMRELGFLVTVAPDLEFQHRLGNARATRLFGRTVMLTGHDPARRTTMVRNRLHLFPREFRQSPRHALRTLRRVGVNHTLGLVYESDRITKLKASLRGIVERPEKKQ